MIVAKLAVVPVPTTFNPLSKEPNFFPEEMLSHIFSYLPLTDRNNARLVCSSWYQAGISSKFLKMEKIVCMPEYASNIKQTFRLLFKSRRQLLNLEFQGFKIDRRSKRFWKECGHKIHSLTFVGCSFKEKTARDVIRYCSQIERLAVNYCDGIFTFNVVDFCLREGITAPSLRELNIMYIGEMTDHIFNRLFKIYPSVRSIAVCLLNDRFYNTTYRNVYFEQDVRSDQPNYDSMEIFSHSAVYNKLKSGLVEELMYREADIDACRMQSNLVAALHCAPNLKLKRFHFRPSYFSAMGSDELPALEMFISAQNNLEDVSLVGIYFSSQGLGRMLDSCPRLRCVVLEDLLERGRPEPMTLRYDIFEKLASASLYTLKLHFDFRFEEKEYARVSGPNWTLRDLSIISPSLLKGDVLLFLETFCNLAYLNLGKENVDNALLQIILKYQVNLVSLILQFNFNITDYGFTGKSNLDSNTMSTVTFSIRRLQKLETLVLTNCEHLTGASISEMVLPNLKFLSLHDCRAIPDASFLALKENCPALEFLDLSHTSISPENLIELSNHLHRLQFLDFTFCGDYQTHLITTLQRSKSLRFICHTTNKFYYNIFKNKWKPIKSRIVMRHKNLVLLIACTVIRLCCLLSRDSYYVADEYWQSLEVAHKLVFGYGYLTWEWIHALRSYIYVSWVAVLYQILKVLRLDTVQHLVWLPCIIQGVFTAISDTYFVAWVHKVSTCQRQAYWSVWCYMTNVFLAYCATRTLTNTIETNLTCVALYYYPWFAHEAGRVKYFWLVCLSCVIRPTAVIQWAPLCFYALLDCKNPFKTLLLKYVPIGLIVLSIATLIDSFLYGKWVLTWWNFILYNIVYNISANYSVHSLYWYFVIGLPVVLGPCIVPFFITMASNTSSSDRPFDGVYNKLKNTVWFSLVLYSFIPHKEFRFILPLIPFMVFISSYTIRKWAAALNKYHTYLLTFTILTISLHAFYYLSQYHQVGTVRVMQYLNDPENSLLFLMPCHLTPLYSHLHVNVTTRFLRCDPNIMGAVNYVEEATKFYSNPTAWLDKEYPMSTKTDLPTHLICFDSLEPHISTFLATRGYEKWLKLYHGHFVPPRVGNYLLVFNRTMNLNFLY